MKFFLLLTMFLYSCNASQASTDEKSELLVLKKTNTLVLNEQVDDFTVAALVSKAYKMNETLPKGEPIYIFLYTPGGSISAGMELCSNLKALGRKFNTITSFAASMGFQIAQCLDDRYVLEAGEYMSHPASTGEGGFSGQFGGVEPSQISSRYQLWVNKIERLDKITVARTKGKYTLESYRQAYDNELWLEGAEAVKKGFADKVVFPTCDKSLTGTNTVTIPYMGLEIILTMSDCPLISGPLGVEVMIYTTNGSLVEINQFKKLNGEFGPSCTKYNITQLCARDTSLSMEKIEELKKEAKNKIKLKKDSSFKGYTL